jgi:Fe-S cluster biogenesis protein NfuA
MTKEQLADCVQRIDSLIADIEKVPDPAVREQAQDVVRCVLDYHALALARLLNLVQGFDGSRHVVEHLAEDELVASLLLLHGLHPADLETRVKGALERVRPFLQSHGGNVELVAVVEGAVHLRLEGSCHGCPSSAATLKSRIEQAIYEAAPEVAAIQVDAPPEVPKPPSGFVGLESLSVGS